MATSELAVIDTNVLVYAFDREAEHFEDSRALVDAARQPDAGLLVTPQVVTEFLAVTTGSRVETPLEPAQAAATLGTLLARPEVLPTSPLHARDTYSFPGTLEAIVTKTFCRSAAQRPSKLSRNLLRSPSFSCLARTRHKLPA